MLHTLMIVDNEPGITNMIKRYLSRSLMCLQPATAGRRLKSWQGNRS